MDLLLCSQIVSNPNDPALACKLLRFPEHEFCNALFLMYRLAFGEGSVTAMPHNTPVKLSNLSGRGVVDY